MVVALRVPAPEPMLQVTPALVESFAMLAVNACVPPAPNAVVLGLTATVIAGGVCVLLDGAPLQPRMNTVDVKRKARSPKLHAKVAGRVIKHFHFRI